MDCLGYAFQEEIRTALNDSYPCGQHDATAQQQQDQQLGWWPRGKFYPMLKGKGKIKVCHVCFDSQPVSMFDVLSP